MNFWAIRRSLSSSQAFASVTRPATSSTFFTPRENDPSGIFSTIGKPSSSAALAKSSFPPIITDDGVATPFAAISSLR